MVISSRKNPAVQRYRRLARERAFRAECGEFALEGARLCAEAANAGLTLTSFFVTEAAREKYPGVYELIAAKAEPAVISGDIADYISDTKTPQGFFLTAKILDKSPETGKIEKGSLLLLDGLQDSGNIGTIIRSCDAFGIDGVFLSPDCADIYSPKTVRGAMGSLFRLPVKRAELAAVIDELRSQGWRVLAAMPDKSAEQLDMFVPAAKTAVVIGNEGNGVSGEVCGAADGRLYIPIQNAESLNAAVAASVICWELMKAKNLQLKVHS